MSARLEKEVARRPRKKVVGWLASAALLFAGVHFAGREGAARAEPVGEGMAPAAPTGSSGAAELERALAGFWRAGVDAPAPAAACPDAATTADAEQTPAQAPLSDGAPTVERLRQEVAENPHAPPASLLDFAVTSYLRLQEAQASPTAAEARMGEMAAALADPAEVPEVVHAVYLEHAQELAQRFPALTHAAQAMWREAPERVRKLTR